MWWIWKLADNDPLRIPAVWRLNIMHAIYAVERVLDLEVAKMKK